MTLQTLDRAVDILHALGSSGDGGLRLIDIQQEFGLARPTAHRILASLLKHGLVRRNDAAKSYHLGSDLALLGSLVANGGVDLKSVAQGSMMRLAAQLGDTVYLTVRSGLCSVCIDRQTGSYPVKVFNVEIGTRRPLGVGAGSIAMMAMMHKAEMMSTLASIETQFRKHPRPTRSALLAAIASTRRTGFALSDGLLLPGVRGLAVGIRDPAGSPIGSIGIVTVAERAPNSRVNDIGRALIKEQKVIEELIRTQVAVGRGSPRPLPRRKPFSGKAGRESMPRAHASK
jgi:DNA-binding IclR family transcriptional regulator